MIANQKKQDNIVKLRHKRLSTFRTIAITLRNAKVSRNHDTDSHESQLRTVECGKMDIRYSDVTAMPTKNLRATIRKYNKGCKPTELRLAGGIFENDIEMLSEYCAHVSEAWHREVTIDMSELYFICLQGVKKLGEAVKEMQQAGTLVKITGLIEEIKQFLTDIGDYTLLDPICLEDSWRRLEYLPADTFGVSIKPAGNHIRVLTM
ncbi:MAG: STAS domain-containing protein [bacterium]